MFCPEPDPILRADAKRKAAEQLEANLLEGLNSPESELTSADVMAIRNDALARLEVQKHHP